MKNKTKKEMPLSYHVEVELCGPPHGFEELELDHLGTVATYIDVTPRQLAELVETIAAVDPSATIDVTQYMRRGSKKIYHGDYRGCLMAMMMAAPPLEHGEGTRA